MKAKNVMNSHEQLKSRILLLIIPLSLIYCTMLPPKLLLSSLP